MVIAVISVAQTANGVKKIVIDAGHGGHDPGCHGAIANEKDVALAIALKFGKYVEDNLPDVEVIYTRKTDVFVELHNRAKIANEAKADLFICIHCNAGPAGAFGTETYIMGAHKNEANLQVAKRENAAILMEDDYAKEYDGFNPNSPEAHVIFSLYQNAFLSQSIHFAHNVQTEFKTKAKRHDRGVRQAGFLVLYRTTMPSVLIETGFLTNTNEEKYLISEQGQDYLASAIYRGFKKYKFGIEGNLQNTGNEDAPLKIEEPVKSESKLSNTDATQEVIENSEKSVPNDTLKEKTRPIKIDESGIVFRIQFMGSLKDIPITSENFSNLNSVYKYKAGGVYKYTAGRFTSFEEAGKYQGKVRALGYKDAFLVAFKNGVRITTKQALAELK